MKRPNGKDYGIGIGFKTDPPYNPIGYNTALKEYIDYLEAQLQEQNLPMAGVVISEERAELNPDKELLDCVHNLMGYFDTPIARLKMKGEDCEEVRKIGREVLSKHNRVWRGV